VWPLEQSPLRHAPHTAEVIGADDWDRPYPRSLGGWPSEHQRRSKYWPPVGRIDGGYGDRNLVCSCPPMEDLAE
jgi:glycine dehydrogenase